MCFFCRCALFLPLPAHPHLPVVAAPLSPQTTILECTWRSGTRPEWLQANDVIARVERLLEAAPDTVQIPDPLKAFLDSSEELE